MKMKKWNEVDETCPQCGAVTKRVRGITKQNLKRLLIPRFDFTEIAITFLLIMIILLAYVYQQETEMCREFIKEVFSEDYETCLIITAGKCKETFKETFPTDLNLTGLNLTIIQP
jgi:RNA polymerase subunit RPABC4/transcription elongation factor Spt4